MKIVGTYSFKGGADVIQKSYAEELKEARQILANIDAKEHKTKRRKDKVLYNPRSLSKALSNGFLEMKWDEKRILREMNFTKNRLGIDIEFKKPLPIYSGCAKMTIFHNMGFIDVGIEIVPVKELAEDMSSGVSYFEQFVWDLEQRGVSDIDIPVLILGVAP